MKRKPKTINFWIGRLPHWEVEDGRYFITLRLAGALPQVAREEIKSKSLALANIATPTSPDWLIKQRSLFAEMERSLDNAKVNLWLTKSVIATMIVEAIETREQRGHWKMFEYVIMGNHIHLFCEFGAKGMKWVMEDFKRWTGHRAAKMMSFKNRFWQREWFDHWSRSDDQDDRIVDYIRNNPVKAGLVNSWPEWNWSSSSLLEQGNTPASPARQAGPT